MRITKSVILGYPASPARPRHGFRYISARERQRRSRRRLHFLCRIRAFVISNRRLGIIIARHRFTHLRCCVVVALAPERSCYTYCIICRDDEMMMMAIISSGYGMPEICGFKIQLAMYTERWNQFFASDDAPDNKLLII